MKSTMLKIFIFMNLFCFLQCETVFRRKVVPDFDATGNLISIRLIAGVCPKDQPWRLFSLFILILILGSSYWNPNIGILILGRVFEAARVRMKISGCQGTGFGQIFQLPNPSTPNTNQKNSKTKIIKISQICLNCPELVRIFQNFYILANRS